MNKFSKSPMEQIINEILNIETKKWKTNVII